MIEQIIFNVLAFTLFIFMFFKMIVRNDTAYLSLLIIEAIGIAINFVGLVFNIALGFEINVIIYLLSVVLPLIILGFEIKGFNYAEVLYVGLAKICLLFHDAVDAKTLLTQLVEKYPRSYIGHKLLAQSYEKQGAMRKAIEEYVKAIDINKKDYQSYYTIAFLLEDLKQLREARTMLEELLQIKPNYYEASDLLGKILYEQENFKEAVNVYKEALKYHPANYDIYYNLGMVYTRLNDFKNAKVCYEKAAEINSLLYTGYYSLAEIALIYGDLEEAECYFSKSKESEQVEAGSYYHLAKIALTKGEFEKATNYINLAIDLDITIAKIAQTDPIFLPIRKYIVIPDKEFEEEPKENTLEKREKETIEHLEETYELSCKLNYRKWDDYEKDAKFKEEELEIDWQNEQQKQKNE